MNIFLAIILFILLVIISRKKGIKIFFSIIINFILLIITFYLIALGLNPIFVSIIFCLITSYIVLFYINGKNQKTKTSFIAIFIVLLLMLLFIYIIVIKAKLGGFGSESSEEINMFSYDININMITIEISLIIIGLIGATIDSSIAISSALYEVYYNNPDLSTKNLIKSGMSIGKDILTTTINTLFFAYLCDFMTLLIWFKISKYSLGDILNAKVFASEFIKILSSGLGCIIIIPITSIISAYIYKNRLLIEEETS